MMIDLCAVEAELCKERYGSCKDCDTKRALLAYVRALLADGRKLWSAVRADDRAGLVMAAHNFGAVLVQAKEGP